MQRIAELKRRAREHDIPVIYANDNFGRWRSDFTEVVRHCLEDGVRGEPIARLLRPGNDDYFVLKPKHSAFFETTLELLLKYLEVDRLILCGFSGDLCVLFTASDAYMRDHHLNVPEGIRRRPPTTDTYSLAGVTQALQAVGNNNYVPTTSAGLPITGTANTAGLGSVVGLSLEASNVDMTPGAFLAASSVTSTSVSVSPRLVIR